MQIFVQKARFSFVWIIDPDIPGLLLHLAQKKFITAPQRVQDDGYQIAFLEPPDVVAVKNRLRICFNPNRRILAVEGEEVEQLKNTVQEVWNALQELGINPDQQALVKEIEIVGRVKDLKLREKKLNNLEGTNFPLIAMCPVVVMKNGNPNSAHWFHFRLTPVWAVWAEEKKRGFHFGLVYRDKKDALFNFLEKAEEAIKDLLNQI